MSVSSALLFTSSLYDMVLPRSFAVCNIFACCKLYTVANGESAIFVFKDEEHL